MVFKINGVKKILIDHVRNLACRCFRLSDFLKQFIAVLSDVILLKYCASFFLIILLYMPKN